MYYAWIPLGLNLNHEIKRCTRPASPYQESKGRSKLVTFASELEGNFDRLINDKWMTVSFYFSYYHQEKDISTSNTTMN